MENETALSLMKRALATYDRNGEGATAAACYLQAAIDAATGAKPLQPGEEIDPDLLDWFEATVRAPAEKRRHLTH
ncbi:hypothetical protein [Sphingomonas abaci]|uniref:Uncharacterized protein n=1 Tax=Sphingomonas abaci TaxID=237611 RepID=A0A7W7AM87_9SPHN|nr:hypothetical protein [Sphingomonas abaci]MBB4619644.1 hypothetical protein [Sphingomonas abaci]